MMSGAVQDRTYNFLISRVYPHVPVFLQNIGLSMWGISYRRERLGGDFPRLVAGFVERERFTPEQMTAYTDKVLRDRVLTAFDHVPYYRERWRQVGLDRETLAGIRSADLACLPLTPKEDLRSRPLEFLPDPPVRPEKLVRYATSGSTGTPISCYYTRHAHQAFIAAREARSFRWAGTSIRARRATFGGRLIAPSDEPPFHRRNYAENQIYLSAFHISPANTRYYADAFNDFQPEVLTGYVSSYYLLSRMMLDQGLKLNYSPKAVVGTSEPVTPEVRRVIRAALNAPVVEEYGSVENLALATECPQGRLHVNPDFGLLEVVDSSGSAVPAGVEGELVLTGLLNDAHHLFRYRIGDLGILSPHKCSCGRDSLPVLERVTGRVEDAIITPDGRAIVRMQGIFYDVPHLIAGQIIQEARDLVRVRMITTDDFSAREIDLIKKRIQSERLGEMRVTFERVDELEKAPSGKVRAVINRLV